MGIMCGCISRAEDKADAGAQEKAPLVTHVTSMPHLEAKAKAEAEERALKEAEAKAKAESEEKTRKEAEAKAKAEAEEKTRKEAEAKAKAEAEERARKEAEAKAKAEAEERARKEAEAKAKAEAEERARKEQAQLAALEEEVTKVQMQHKTSLSQLEKNLSDLGDKLQKAESSMSPWADITDAKRHLGDVQRGVDQEMNHTEQQLLSNPQSSDASADAPKVNALQEELVQSRLQRKDSLSAVSGTLAELSAKIETAEGSWAPWLDIQGAKKQLEETQNTITQQQEDNLAGDKVFAATTSDAPPVLV